MTVGESADDVCNRSGGSVKVIACIEDQRIIDQILDHLRRKEQDTPTRPLLVPPSRAPPDALPLFNGKEPTSKPFHQQGRQRVVTDKESIGIDSFVPRHADRRK